MNIAIDSGPLSGGHSVRGIGFYTGELISSLKKHRRGVHRLIVDEFDFSTNKKSFNSKRYDILHSPFFHPYFLTVPFSKSAKVVVSILDLIQLIYPRQHPPGIKGRLRFLFQKYRARKADAIITISETSKKDIVRFLGIPAEKITVTYLAPRSIFKKISDKKYLELIRNKYKLPKKFILYVGDINYQKNVLNLIKACKRLNVSLVIIGKQALEIKEGKLDLKGLLGPRDWLRFIFDRPHPEVAHNKKLIKAFKGYKKVVRLGFVSDEDLVALYNLSAVYCQPSLYEGFGLPVLEAMACGSPVVINKTQALVEIAGDTAEISKSDSSSDLAKAIERVLNNKKLASEMSKKGVKHAAEFNWEKVAKETVDVYKKVLT